ncbi:hypothetical protein BDP27DRAFT_1207287 [Rhodocollybia butyracea]|uniref:Uncharacterized protein n=1 Tax=Rhodocollybia butyracea TaxID=206335 RepID=A0A9P5Q4I7_9AGAR|nr:hypothetical protein BDP27DRAFT_1207287 [Rhodocollybia butyracea]
MAYFPSSSAENDYPRSSYSGTHGDTQNYPGSSVLWAHLLRKDVLASPSKSDLPLPPLAPVDKNGTSTRILLLDTQANLQKFGQVVGELTSKVDHAKHEIVTVKNLFQQDREAFMNEFVEKLNRSQSEIHKSLGKPAQNNKLEDLQKNFELRFENMDQRLIAMQMVYVCSFHCFFSLTRP